MHFRQYLTVLSNKINDEIDLKLNLNSKQCNDNNEIVFIRSGPDWNS